MVSVLNLFSGYKTASNILFYLNIKIFIFDMF